MYYMMLTCPPSWTSKGLLSVLRDTLPEHELASVLAPDAVPGAPLPGDVEARQARIDRMAHRLKQLVQVADAPAAAAVTA